MSTEMLMLVIALFAIGLIFAASIVAMVLGFKIRWRMKLNDKGGKVSLETE